MKKIIIITIALGLITIIGQVFVKNTIGTQNHNQSQKPTPLSTQKLRRAVLSIDGMWCASCATGAEYNLKTIEGVTDAYVSFQNNSNSQGWVIYEANKVSTQQIINAIKPYQATIISDMTYTQ